MDLHTRFERLAGPIEPAAADDIAADLTRGHRAVRRRRTAQMIGGSALGVAALVAAFAFTTAGLPGNTGPQAAPIVAQSTTGGIKLVAYTGAQAKYFTIDKVPEGYFVQNDDENGLTLAPLSAQNPSPGVDPSKAPIYDPLNLENKIGIYLEQKGYRGTLDGEKVTVGDHQAILHPIGPTWQLIISMSPDVYATIQFDVALSRAQMLEVGNGLHVDPDAVTQAGAATGK